MHRITLNGLPHTRLWKPVYGRFNELITRQRIADLRAAGADESLLAKTETFVDQAYGLYSGRLPSRKYGFVFAIPTRITRHPDADVSEARHFLPIVEQLTPQVAQIFISEMPPSILDEYHDRHGHTVGAIVFVPLLGDMVHDLRPKLYLGLKAHGIVRQTALFARDKLQAEIVGLGATLPKLTRFGRDLARHGLQTTTGHGGTVYLIYRSYNDLSKVYDPNHVKTIGVIGAGSIGNSAAQLLLERYPDVSVIMYDIRPNVLRKVVERLDANYAGRCQIATSNKDVRNRATIILSAITSRLKIDDDEDLSGKVIIDDSQPGSFDVDDVEAHGGKLVWVVGHDYTSDKILTCRSEFRYGDAGLSNPGDVWGCEAEVAMLWRAGKTELALREEVSPQAALAIGEVLEEAGIDRAPWQAYGHRVIIPKAVL